MTELYVLRHGETVWNLENRMQGGLDSPLTALGRSQAEAQGAALRAAGLANMPVRCSPQGRAQETARIALPGVPVQTDSRLSEVGMGDWQGRTMAEIAEEHPGLMQDPHPFLWKFEAPGGEPLVDMLARVDGFLTDMIEPAIVITHGVTSQMLRGRILGLSVEEMGDLEDRQGVVYHVSEAGHGTLTKGKEFGGRGRGS